MVGIITLNEINEIIDEYGLSVAVKATYWTGTWLSFLAHHNLI